ncbi:MAG: methyltransferase domain-containing protein [Chlorobiaceae bacterium]|nr:methyltransferase domain-containing protein [Chlorobiaceae bacterium]
MSDILISKEICNLLCCPVCSAKLTKKNQLFKCNNSGCLSEFPIIDDIPVLINEKNSIFNIDDFVFKKKTFFDNSDKNNLKKIFRLIPSISKNIKAKSNYIRVTELLLKQNPNPKVLVIGGSIIGQGMEYLINNNAIDLVETDVSFGERTMLICDTHDIPFQDNSFDCVIVQAVLEHVVDPYRCVEEIYRVLSPKGVVYAETPFMQQVHGGRYDFTRFSHLGHRRLFRQFQEIDSGAVCGTGMALAWAYKYFLMSFTTSKKLRSVLCLFATLTSFYLKYFDYYLINKPSTLDAASGYYFIGNKTDNILSDIDLIKLYKGAME